MMLGSGALPDIALTSVLPLVDLRLVDRAQASGGVEIRALGALHLLYLKLPFLMWIPVLKWQPVSQV